METETLTFNDTETLPGIILAALSTVPKKQMLDTELYTYLHQFNSSSVKTACEYLRDKHLLSIKPQQGFLGTDFVIRFETWN